MYRISAFAAVTLAALLPGGCQQADSKSSSGETGTPAAAGGRVVVSKDGLSQVRVPDGWEELDGLNDAAVLQAGDRERKAYFVVRTFAKRDWPGDDKLGTYAAQWVEAFRVRFADSRVRAGPTGLVVGGRPAVQYEFAGLAPENKFHTVLIHTTVDGREHYHELVAWTNQRRADENRPTLQAVVAIFAETTGQADK